MTGPPPRSPLFPSPTLSRSFLPPPQTGRSSGGDPPNLVPDDLRVSRGEPRGRLVEQHDHRVDHQSPGDAQEISLSAAQSSPTLGSRQLQVWKDVQYLGDALLEPGLAREAAHLEVLHAGQAREYLAHLPAPTQT